MDALRYQVEVREYGDEVWLVAKSDVEFEMDFGSAGYHPFVVLAADHEAALQAERAAHDSQQREAIRMRSERDALAGRLAELESQLQERTPMKRYTIEATGFADDIWATCGDRRVQMQPHQQFVLAEDAAAALTEERERSALAERVLDVGFYVDHYCEQCSRPIYEGEPRVLGVEGGTHCWRHSGNGKPDDQCVTNETFASLMPTLGRRQQLDAIRAERDALAARVKELEAELSGFSG